MSFYIICLIGIASLIVQHIIVRKKFKTYDKYLEYMGYNSLLGFSKKDKFKKN